ncbi:MAG: helix-turn-helix domain-containing protein, partial [Deltaproteobacteria bacterium]|nr:helix-turn-helix domain-containing protein [Deltaproteobacteria bacterium]
ARMLDQAIQNSPLTQAEIAMRAGFPKPNVLSMMKNGLTKVPLARVPALAQALGIEQTQFLDCALAEYHPEVYQILTEVLGLPLAPDEEALLGLYRIANLNGNIRLEGALRDALVSLLELANLAYD